MTDFLQLIGPAMTHSDAAAPAYEKFGIPAPLLRIAKNIFNRLPADEATAFFAALPGAVARDGKDLTRVQWRFLAAELRALPAVEDHVQAVIDPVIAGMDLLSEGKEWSEMDAEAAAAAAVYAASDADAHAADAAAHAANAAAAAAAHSPHAAYSVAPAASAAVYAAVFAAARADAAARAPAYAAAVKRQRDTLLRLIAEAV